MKIYKSLNDRALRAHNRCLAIGIFDGVHVAHQKVLKVTLAFAKSMRAKSCVLTFHPHPESVLRPEASKTPYLMSLEHRLRILSQMGFDEVLVLPFNLKLAKVSAEDFIRKILVKKLQTKVISIGDDFRFGAKAEGDSRYLLEMAATCGFKVLVSKKVKYGSVTVSSTQIRKYISTGQLEKAKKMLARPISIYGTVIHGHKRGKLIGHRTANLDPHHEALPPQGVYACYGFWKGRRIKGVVNIGPRPTFQETEPSIEVHFLNFNTNIYDEDLELFFVKKIRAIQKFSTPAELKLAIKRDIVKAKHIFYL